MIMAPFRHSCTAINWASCSLISVLNGMSYVIISLKMSPQLSTVDYIIKSHCPSILQQSETSHAAIFPYVMANELIAVLEEEFVLGVSMSLLKREKTVRAGSGLQNHRGTDTITTV